MAYMVATDLMWRVFLFLICSWAGISWIVYKLEYKAQGANITSYGEAIWWGVVTFLTVGYGDRYPITPEGRIFGALLMLAGVGAVGIVTAKISQYFLEQALRNRRGEVKSETLKDHFVICGWKEGMVDFLKHILDFNNDLEASQIVIVANLNENHIDQLRDDTALREVQTVVGDYWTEPVLRKAVPQKARKVMIMADAMKGPSGQMFSATETDARTIMTAMTLANIAKGTEVTAEILDPKMDHYLKLAGVSEIIYSREYNRLLLVNASGGTGVANIIFDLLDPHTSSVLTTAPIPDHLLDKPYSELKREMAQSKTLILLGVLENSGNKHRIKELALRRAQKTVNVTQLLTNLNSVREMKCNHPVFNPADDYMIREGALAIVVETRDDFVGKETSGARPQVA